MNEKKLVLVFIGIYLIFDAFASIIFQISQSWVLLVFSLVRAGCGVWIIYNQLELGKVHKHFKNDRRIQFDDTMQDVDSLDREKMMNL